MMEQRYLEEIKKRFPTVRSEDISEHDAGWDYFVYAVKGGTAFRFPRNEYYVRQLPNEVAFLQDFAPLMSRMLCIARVRRTCMEQAVSSI